MFGFFGIVMYAGVVAGVIGFALPYGHDVPLVGALDPRLPRFLSFGGLALILVGLIGRTLTRPDDD